MSFAVFGASLDYCTKVARKRVKPVKGSGKNLVQLTAEEWESEVTKYAQKLFDDIKAGKKTAPKISADMTQPSAAKEFIALAKKTTVCENLRIFQRAPVKGRTNPKTKQPIMKFQPWPLVEDVA